MIWPFRRRNHLSHDPDVTPAPNMGKGFVQEVRDDLDRVSDVAGAMQEENLTVTSPAEGRVDHAETALEQNRYAMHHANRLGRHEVSRWQNSAQIHATLALAEQQRIANLIEISRGIGHPERDPEDSAALADQAFDALVEYEIVEVQGWEGPEEYDRPGFRERVRTALGLIERESRL